MTGTEIVFVDTNVFVYASDPRDRAKQSLASGWIERLWREGRGCISVQVVSEFYVNLKRKLRVPEDQAWEEALELMAWQPLATDHALLMRARELEERYRASWWDCLLIASAERQGCEVMLTEDLQDGQVYGSVTVRSPFALEVREPEAAWT
jgi:predicted nucleic acid-binding protein